MSFKAKLEESPAFFFITTFCLGMAFGYGFYEGALRFMDRRTISNYEMERLTEQAGAANKSDESIALLRSRLENAESLLKEQRDLNDHGKAELSACNKKQQVIPGSSQSTDHCEEQLRAFQKSCNTSFNSPECDRGLSAGKNEPQEDPATIIVQAIDWKTTAKEWCDHVGQSFTVQCPGGGVVGVIQGYDEYVCSSSICTAATHAGKINPRDGGEFSIRMLGVTGKVWNSAARNGVLPKHYSRIFNRTDDPVFAIE